MSHAQSSTAPAADIGEAQKFCQLCMSWHPKSGGKFRLTSGNVI